MYVRTFIHVCMNAHMYICTNVCMYVCADVDVRTMV